MGALARPPTRGELGRALVANALLKTWPNVVLPAGLAVAGVALGAFWTVLVLALVAWLALSAITYFDEDEAEAVGARVRAARRGGALPSGEERVDLGGLAPPIASLLRQAREREERIRRAIEQASLPFAEVSDEVDRFVRLAEKTAARAQLLYDGLLDNPPDQVERRLDELRREDAPDRATLRDALATQLATQRRMEQQLDRFYGQMELMLVEMDTVRGQLLSVSATTEAAAQHEVAGEVRGLREQMGAVAESMTETFEEAGRPGAA